MLKFVSASILVIASLAVGVGTARADVDDCIDYMVSRGSSARDARLACSKASDNSNSKPNSGRLSEAQQFCFAAQRGNGETLRYSNGQVMTYNAGRIGASWYYPNGKVMTYNAGKSGASWYYANGQVLTYNAGTQGATWYYANGQVVTYGMNKDGATWYYPNGNVISNNSRLSISEQQLLYPCDHIE
ncbi:hypothetical protein [Pseudanabaena mucicola]|uniref:Uncharacterized protein n=1 Tax=Pseudanabaena mucicola FACHB-723 TaxID=2692860 RepID=A0ABR7ZX71_9CYAN|nr:hypothetical protein [Pseudanabaena mucicola]MBD2188422.1 hypothetical protein [Pseudanabaena mucicola FACHB-723]